MAKEKPGADVIEKAMRGDISAFEALVKHYEGLVYNMAYQTLSNREDAFDVSQEVFLKIYRSIGSFRGECEFSTWLFRIASNTIKDFLRARIRHPVYPLTVSDSNGEEHMLEIPDENDCADPNFTAERNERAKAIRSAIGMLSEEHRNIIILREFECYSYEEIARILKIETGTVKSRLSRAKISLKNILEKRNIL